MSRASAEVRETAEYLEHVPKGPLKALLSLFGLPRGQADVATAAAMEEACAKPGGTLTILRFLKDKRLVPILGRCALRGEIPDPRWGGEADLYDDDGLEPEEGRELVKSLIDRGLIAEVDYYRFGMLPALARTMRPAAVEVALGPMAGDGREAPPYPFALALVACLYGQEQPALTNGGEINAASEKRIFKRVGGEHVLEHDAAHAARRLRWLGALVDRGTGGRKVLALDPARAASALATDPEDLALAFLPQQGTEHGETLVLGMLGAATQGRGDAGATLDEITECGPKIPRSRGYALEERRFDAWEVSRCLRSLRSSGLVERVPDVMPTRLRLSRPPPHGTGSWVVQPSFDVLVPWDVPAANVVRLGAVADLEKADRVCRFRVTKGSVARALASLGEPAKVVEALTCGARDALPQNVRATVEGWLGRAAPMRPVRGEVVVTHDAEQRDLVLRAAPTSREIAPGVFWLGDESLSKIHAAAGRADVPVAPLLDAYADRGGWRGEPREILDIAKRAAGARAMLEQVRAAALREKADATQAIGDKPAKKSPRGGKRQERVWIDDDDDDAKDEDDRDDEDEDDEVDVEDEELDVGSVLEELASRFLAKTRADASSSAVHPLPHVVRDSGETAWRPLLPGALRAVLQDAIAAQSPVSLLYVNGKQETSEFEVVPKALRSGGLNDTLLARDVQRGTDVTLILDRITAVRG